MANKNYLDKSGLQYFWGRVKEWITGKHYLSYDEQSLTDAQKTQARTNIDAISSMALPTAASSAPLMDASTAAVGTSTKYAREDHKHPIDTSRAPLASPHLTGTPTAPTATAGTSTSQIATTEFVSIVESSLNSSIIAVNSAVETAQGTADSALAEAIAASITASGAQDTANSALTAASSALESFENYRTSASQDIIDEGIITRVGNLEDAQIGAYNVFVAYTSAQILTDAQKAQARTNIGAVSRSDIGTVFTIKGEVATYEDLPASGNAVGDVYYVSSISAGYIWLETTDHPNGYWEELGEPIDLSAYRTAAAQDIIDAAQDTAIAAKYTKPSDGIPKADLAEAVQEALVNANSAYIVPEGGIPSSDMTIAVQSSLALANTALQTHQDISGKVDKVEGKQLSTNDYDNTAKGKVDAIPSNPQYTDTIYDDTALSTRVSTIEGKESDWDAKYTKPSDGIPSSDMAAAVQSSLALANSALQSAPVTSVNGQTGVVLLTIPSTASDVGAIAAPASPSNNAILMYNATTSSWEANVLAIWSGGSY